MSNRVLFDICPRAEIGAGLRRRLGPPGFAPLLVGGRRVWNGAVRGPNARPKRNKITCLVRVCAASAACRMMLPMRLLTKS